MVAQDLLERNDEIHGRRLFRSRDTTGPIVDASVIYWNPW